MARRKLKLNDGKTEVTVIKGNLRNVSVTNFGVMSFGDTQLIPYESAKNLSVVLDFFVKFWIPHRFHCEDMQLSYS